MKQVVRNAHHVAEGSAQVRTNSPFARHKSDTNGFHKKQAAMREKQKEEVAANKAELVFSMKERAKILTFKPKEPTFADRVFRAFPLAAKIAAGIMVVLLPVFNAVGIAGDKDKIVAASTAKPIDFKVEIKTEILYVSGQYSEGTYSSKISLNALKQVLKEKGGNEKLAETVPIRAMISNLGELGPGLYLIYPSAIIWFNAQTEINTAVPACANDGSVIFTDVIYQRPDGSIIATTPTTLLVVTPSGGSRVAYGEFGKVPPLEKPTITAGKDDYTVEVRDPVMGKAKVVVDLRVKEKVRVSIAKDDLYGAR